MEWKKEKRERKKKKNETYKTHFAIVLLHVVEIWFKTPVPSSLNFALLDCQMHADSNTMVQDSFCYSSHQHLAQKL